MIQQLTSPMTEDGTDVVGAVGAVDSGRTTRSDARFTMWGLSVRELHDAFWHARGVQCVRRSERSVLQRAAEAYLLIEPSQLVLFDMAELAERLTWHNAVVTRLRLVDPSHVRYSEHVELDADGAVRSISRRYRPRQHTSHRVVLTTSRRLAAIWMHAQTQRAGWDRVRRSVPWSRVDHWRCTGRVFSADSSDQTPFLDELVEGWPNPGQSIAGLREAEPGVWFVDDSAIPSDEVRVGPLWLGFRPEDERNPCLVGPRWIADGDGEVKRTAEIEMIKNGALLDVHVRDIVEVELADREHDTRVAQRDDPRHGYWATKRLIDIIGASTVIIVASPILLAIGLAVKLDDAGPAFFRQTRQGKGGRPFGCLKFRTMQVDAERVLIDLGSENLCDGPQINIRNDPRVTRIGRLLRKTHLDELPQLWNVLRGQMSLVGPRPSPDDENQFCPAWRDLRLSVRPGITGLWQLERTRVPGEDFQEWIKYDIEYVRNAGFWFDLKIMARTALVLILGRD